jgi:TRAP-type transport system periplasmic protein
LQRREFAPKGSVIGLRSHDFVPTPRRVARRSLVLGSVASLAGIGIVPAPAKAAQFEFRVASSLPIDHPTTIRGKQMWAAIDRESGGRIHTSFFPNSQLGGNPALLQQLRVGATHFSIMNGGDLASVVPATDIANLGFAFSSGEEALKVIDGPLGDYIRKEVAAKGMYPMRSILDSGIRQIISSTRPIRTPDDMNGFKIRVVESRIIVDFFRTLGANPTPLSSNETYTALQTRVVDGCDYPLVSIEANRFYEVQKYLSITNHSWSAVWWLANGDVWKGLAPDLQAVVERNMLKYAVLERRDSIQMNSATQEKLARRGMIVNKPDIAPFRARLRPYYGRWSNEFGATEWGLLQNAIGNHLG